MLDTTTIDKFRELLRAARDGHLILLDCTDAQTGDPVAAICEVNPVDGMLRVLPFATMIEGDPFRTLAPPQEETAAR